MPVYVPGYTYWKYDLGIARTDEKLGLSGTNLIVYRNPVTVELRLDDIRNDKITIRPCDPTSPIIVPNIPFSEIWMTNDAVDGHPQIEFIITSGERTALDNILEEIRKPKGLDRLMYWLEGKR